MKWLIWIIVILIIIGGGWYLMSQDSGDTMIDGDNMDSMEGDSMMEDDMPEGAMMEDGTIINDDIEAIDDGTTMQRGSYEAYSSNKLAMADNGPVVLFFRASWCPTCKALDADINAREGMIPAGVTILDVDYDNSEELKKKYGVTYQHTLVQVDAQGNMITKWSGSPTLAALVDEIDWQ